MRSGPRADYPRPGKRPNVYQPEVALQIAFAVQRARLNVRGLGPTWNDQTYESNHVTLF